MGNSSYPISMLFYDHSFLLQVTSSSEVSQPPILLPHQNSVPVAPNKKAAVLAWEEVIPELPVQKSSETPKAQSLITKFFKCSKQNCDFETKEKRCLDTHIRGWSINLRKFTYTVTIYKLTFSCYSKIWCNLIKSYISLKLYIPTTISN